MPRPRRCARRCSTRCSRSTAPVRESVEHPPLGPRGARGAGRGARARGEALGADAERVFFTSGGTEADNLAILGAWRCRRESREARGRHDADRAQGGAGRRRTRRRTGGGRGADARRGRQRRWSDGRALRCARARRHGGLLGDVGEQRDRHHPAASPNWRGGAKSRGRALPHRRGPGVRQGRRSTRAASPFDLLSHLAATRSARPRESARCTSGAARRSSRSSTAARRSAAVARERRTSPPRWRSRARRSWRWRSTSREMATAAALRDRARGARSSRRIPDAVVHGAGRPARAARPERLGAGHRQRVDADGARPRGRRLLRRAPRARAGAWSRRTCSTALGVPPELAIAAIRMSLGSLHDRRVHRPRGAALPGPRREGARPRGRRELTAGGARARARRDVGRRRFLGGRRAAGASRATTSSARR